MIGHKTIHVCSILNVVGVTKKIDYETKERNAGLSQWATTHQKRDTGTREREDMKQASFVITMQHTFGYLPPSILPVYASVEQPRLEGSDCD